MAVKDVTSQEAWNEIKPHVNHFIFSGCFAHAHIPYAKRSRLDNKILVLIFLGVCENNKGCRLFNKVKNKIIISLDMVFQEDEQREWGKMIWNIGWYRFIMEMKTQTKWGEKDNENEGDVNVSYGNRKIVIEIENEQEDENGEEIKLPWDEIERRDDEVNMVQKERIKDPIHLKKRWKIKNGGKPWTSRSIPMKRTTHGHSLNSQKAPRRLKSSGLSRLSEMKMARSQSIKLV